MRTPKLLGQEQLWKLFLASFLFWSFVELTVWFLYQNIFLLASTVRSWIATLLTFVHLRSLGGTFHQHFARIYSQIIVTVHLHLLQKSSIGCWDVELVTLLFPHLHSHALRMLVLTIVNNVYLIFYYNFSTVSFGGVKGTILNLPLSILFLVFI